MPSKLIFASITFNASEKPAPRERRVDRDCRAAWFFENEIKSGKSVDEVKRMSRSYQDEVYEMESWEPKVFTVRTDPEMYIAQQMEKYRDVFDSLTDLVATGTPVYLEDLPVQWNSKKEGVRAIVKDGFVEFWITIHCSGGYNCDDWYGLYYKVANATAVNKHGERLLARCDHGFLDFQEL